MVPSTRLEEPSATLSSHVTPCLTALRAVVRRQCPRSLPLPGSPASARSPFCCCCARPRMRPPIDHFEHRDIGGRAHLQCPEFGQSVYGARGMDGRHRSTSRCTWCFFASSAAASSLRSCTISVNFSPLGDGAHERRAHRSGSERRPGDRASAGTPRPAGARCKEHQSGQRGAGRRPDGVVAWAFDQLAPRGVRGVERLPRACRGHTARCVPSINSPLWRRLL